MDQTGQQYSATEKQRARADVRKVSALAPRLDPTSLDRRLFLLSTLSAVFCRCSLYDKVCGPT